MQNIVPGALQRLRAADIIRMAGLGVAAAGQEYCRSGAVHNTQRQGMRLSGVVEVPHNTTSAAEVPAAETHIYSVEVEIQSVSSWVGNCQCRQSTSSSLCVHAAALLYQWLARPALFVSSTTTQQEPDTGNEEAETLEHTLKPEHVPAFTKPQIAPGNPMPPSKLQDILTQLGLSELRSIAREYEIVPNGMNKPQLVEAINEVLNQPEAVRKVAATLEKPQRQLLAALTLAGGSLTDEELRGLFERFSLGQPGQLQSVLLTLQGKALLFRTSLNGSSQQRISLSGSLLDIGWYVPREVRTALRVMVPVTPFRIKADEEDNKAPLIKEQEPYSLLADLLLVARVLDGYHLTSTDEWRERNTTARSEAFAVVRPNVPLSVDGSVPVPPPDDMPSEALVTSIRSTIERSPAFLRFAIQLLRLADILHKDDNDPSFLRVLPNAAQLLLGPARKDAARDLFELWLAQSSYTELFDLREDGLRLRCRATSLNLPALRPGELDEENSEARRFLVALLAQAPLNQWINFTAFARFVYRLNPTFLQKRQRLFSSPHWWLEQEEGRPLRPSQLSDWLRAEIYYIARFLYGPLHWWGICDIALTPDGRLLAFRLTPLAGWLLNDIALENGPPIQNYHDLANPLEIIDNECLLVSCSPTAWPLIEMMEMFAEPGGVRKECLCYRLTPKALGEALSRGKRPTDLLELLRITGAQQQADGTETALSQILAQLERWIASYGRVRIYTGVTLLGTADAVGMRELSATTSLEGQIVRTVHPTLHILKKAGSERILDDLKRRGQSPLVHDEELYGTE
ncbi:MAG: hypothetical protein JO011_05870 [Ktedonobacteraceae bacterium]|nr:hypothetical protein [Ktedonobacteraceae bacterium]